MNSQIEMMKKAIDDASHEKGIVWNKVTWYSWTLAIIVFFFAIPALSFYIGMEYQKLKADEIRAGIIVDDEASACTEEARVCPDGSSVSRMGPTCEFPACPSGSVPSKGTSRSPAVSAPPVACTMDAKVCPDGSAVGRTAPQCEFAKCPSSSGRPELKGKATMSPTCPVERVPADSLCAPKPYEGSLEVWTQKGGFIKSFATKIDGTFATELTPGTYIIQRPKSASYFPSLSPVTFTMEQGKLTELTLDLETGIR
jgi:hypothetical protein